MRSVRLISSLLLMAAAMSGCGLGGNAASPGAHQLATAQGGSADAYSTHRVVVTYQPGSEGATRAALTSRYGLKLVRDLPQLGMSVLAVSGSTKASSLLSTLAQVSGVASVEADARVRTHYAPQDPYATTGRTPGQYDGWRREMSQAWDITLGDPAIVVAVVDTGVDMTHPELRDHVVAGQNFVTQVEEQDYETGATKLVDVPDHGPMDDAGHGTHVAGIIAAAENHEGVTGVAPRCRIMPVKSLAYNESGFSADVAQGVVWATDHGARVINMSLGAYGGSKALERAVSYALAHNVVVCAAMGNDRDDPTHGYGTSPSYPAALPGVIAVGATDGLDGATYFSNAGRWISVAAPGDSIFSTTPTYRNEGHTGLNYDVMSGTSMATPFVAGTAALILSMSPRLTPAEVKARLEQSADDVGSPGFDTLTGAGRINPYRALGGK